TIPTLRTARTEAHHPPGTVTYPIGYSSMTESASWQSSMVARLAHHDDHDEKAPLLGSTAARPSRYRHDVQRSDGHFACHPDGARKLFRLRIRQPHRFRRGSSWPRYAAAGADPVVSKDPYGVDRRGRFLRRRYAR